MIDITSQIKEATLDDWDNLNLSHTDWNIPEIFEELVNDNNEKHIQGLYLHLQKNEICRAIYDNNSPPKVINHAHTYMIKWGKFTEGILRRRQDDFRDHYHFRPPTFPVPINVSVRFRQYRRPPNNPKPIVDQNFRSGSSSTLLHLIHATDTANENELGQRIKESFNQMGTVIPQERINIPIDVIDEQELRNQLINAFEDFCNHH